MTGPTLTPYTSGNPWIEAYFNPADLDPAAAFLRMFRYSDGRTWKVRGGVEVAVGVAAQDFEAPFVGTSVYRAEQLDASGVSLGYTDSSETTLDVQGTWVHNPLDPANGIRVDLDDDAGVDLLRPMPGEIVYPDGAIVGRRIGSRRRGLNGVFMSISVDDLATANALQAMLGSYDEDEERVSILCLRSSITPRWPSTFFFSAQQLVERDRSVRYGGTWLQFVGNVDEVQPPFPGLVKSLLSYDDLDAYYGDYDLMDAAYSSATEKDRDYSLAGYADL